MEPPDYRTKPPPQSLIAALSGRQRKFLIALPKVLEKAPKDLPIAGILERVGSSLKWKPMKTRDVFDELVKLGLLWDKRPNEGLD